MNKEMHSEHSTVNDFFLIENVHQRIHC